MGETEEETGLTWGFQILNIEVGQLIAYRLNSKAYIVFFHDQAILEANKTNTDNFKLR